MFRLVGFLLIGLAAGWLAGQILKQKSRGLIGNLVIGVLGSFVGGLLFWLVGFAAIGTLGSLISATVGSVVLLFLLQKVRG